MAENIPLENSYLAAGSIYDLENLQKISQTAYLEAFCDLLNRDDVTDYVMCKYSLENLRKELENALNHFLLYYVDNKAVGYMKYIIEPSSLEIERLYMLKNCKGLGAGSKLVNKAEEVAKLNRIKFLTLGVLEINKSAISFYEKRGFVQYSREAVSIGRNEYPLLLMKKEIA